MKKAANLTCLLGSGRFLQVQPLLLQEQLVPTHFDALPAPAREGPESGHPWVSSSPFPRHSPKQVATENTGTINMGPIQIPFLVKSMLHA